MSLKIKLRQSLIEGDYVVNVKDLTKLKPQIEKNDPQAIIKVVDPSSAPSYSGNKNVSESENEEETDESYNIYAICTKSTGETKGNEKWEKCVKSLKNKKGYKLGESINPKMTKQELIETILNSDKKVITRIKVKNI
jgi:hypothetical protein